MSKNDQQNTNKTGDKPVAGPKNPLRKDSKPRSKAKAERIKADAADKPEISNLKKENKPKAVPEINKPEITKMDVVHHPQLDHKPKPWKEYLLEGFMIFIAVMMGFIAESVRSDITDNEHARQLTSQLVQDLKTDTIQLNQIYRGETLIVKYNDTLLNLLQQPLEKTDTRRIQKLAANSHSIWLFHASGGAIAAIKNELHLKQFSNSKLISYFATYERHIELLHTDQDISLQYQRIYLEPFITLHFTPANMIAAFSNSSGPTAQMRNLTQGDIDQLAADMVLIRIVSKEMVTDSRSTKADAVNLLRYVTKQYHLEE